MNEFKTPVKMCVNILLFTIIKIYLKEPVGENLMDGGLEIELDCRISGGVN